MPCPHCAVAAITERPQRTSLGYRTVRCSAGRRVVNQRTGTSFNHLQYPTDLVLLVVRWRLRSTLSWRDLAAMVLTRGVVWTPDAVREWEARFAPLLTAPLRPKRRGQAGTSWYVDEAYRKVSGAWCSLYRAIDRDGNLVDVRLRKTRDRGAAQACFRQAVATTGQPPERGTTDGHTAYPRAVRAVLGEDVRHRTSRYLNNRIEHDHRSITQRDDPMRGFKTVGSAARSCSAHEEHRQYFRTWRTTGEPVSLAERRQQMRKRWADPLRELQVA